MTPNQHRRILNFFSRSLKLTTMAEIQNLAVLTFPDLRPDQATLSLFKVKSKEARKRLAEIGYSTTPEFESEMVELSKIYINGQKPWTQ